MSPFWSFQACNQDPSYRSVNFEMSFWCHRLDQNSNENIVRIFCISLSGGFLEAFWGLSGDLGLSK